VLQGTYLCQKHYNKYRDLYLYRRNAGTGNAFGLPQFKACSELVVVAVKL